jgi:hypothetical protein
LFSRSRLLVALVGAASALLAPSIAVAETDTLTLSLPPTATVGTPILITASGVDNASPPGDFRYLDMDTIPASVTTTCPNGYLNGEQLSSGSGGTYIAFDQEENYDASGNFSNPNSYTPPSTGEWLICAYTDDGLFGDTFVVTPATLNVVPAVVKPTATVKPRVSRSHNTLSCSRGSWSGSPSSYAYSWAEGSKRLSGTRAKLKVTHKLRGHKVRCSVTATNSAGSSTATSPAFRVH